MGKTDQLLELTQSLSLLLDSGLTIHEALVMSSSLQEGKQISAMLGRLAEKLEGGSSFSRALGDEDFFPPLYKGLVEVGENTGLLAPVLKQLSAYLERDRRIGQRLSSVMIYPSLLLLIMILGLGGLVFLLLPRLRAELSFDVQIAAQLDLIILKARVFLSAFILSSSLMIALPFLYSLLAGSESSLSHALHRGALRVPWVGSFMIKREMLNLFFSLTLTSQCRMPIETSLDLASGVMGNRFLRKKVCTIRDGLVRGYPLSSLFMGERLFPSETGRWIAIGERVGEVEKVFGQLRTYYEGEIEKRVERMLALIEPLTSVFIGFVMLLVVFLLIVPLLTIYGGLL